MLDPFEVGTSGDAMGAALERAVTGAKALPVTIDGFGAFPNAGRPAVVWAGVVNEPALELLQHGVEQAFAPLGFPPEGRPLPRGGQARFRLSAPGVPLRSYLSVSDTQTRTY